MSRHSEAGEARAPLLKNLVVCSIHFASIVHQKGVFKGTDRLGLKHKIGAMTLPFPDKSIEFVYSFGVMHQIPEIGKVIAEIYRVLKPDGAVIIAFYHKWSAYRLFSKLLANGVLEGWLFTRGTMAYWLPLKRVPMAPK